MKTIVDRCTDQMTGTSNLHRIAGSLDIGYTHLNLHSLVKFLPDIINQTTMRRYDLSPNPKSELRRDKRPLDPISQTNLLLTIFSKFSLGRQEVIER